MAATAPSHCAGHHPACLHRRRTTHPRRVPGRIPRPDQGGVCAGPAAIHHLVPRLFLGLFAVRRADIESFARELEARGRARRPPAGRRARCGPGRRRETRSPLADGGRGRRLDRHGAGRIVRKTARRAGIAKTVTPHTLRHAFITAALDAGVPLRDTHEAASHADPRTTMRYDRARSSLDRHATYVVAAYVAGATR